MGERITTTAQLASARPGSRLMLAGWVVEGRGSVLKLLDAYGQVGVELVPTAAREKPSVEDIVRVAGRWDGARLLADELVILSRAAPLPLVGRSSNGSVPLKQRLRHRYLDLRRPRLQERMRQRHRFFLGLRQALDRRGFLEIDTPTLQRWSPAATTAFLVPSTSKACFSLCQSAQLHKQLLMVAGFDRVFQLQHGFRQERHSSPWHQPEFALLDVEMGFVESEDALFTVVEEVLAEALESVGCQVPLPFQRRVEGVDLGPGPDRRVLDALVEVDDILGETALDLLAGLPQPTIRALKVEQATKQQLEALAAEGGQRVGWVQVDQRRRLSGPLASGLGLRAAKRLLIRVRARGGDGIVVLAAPDVTGCHQLAAGLGELLYGSAADGPASSSDQGLQLTWVYDRPFFAYSEEAQGWMPACHPLTRPHPDDLGLLPEGPLPRRDPEGGVPLGAACVRPRTEADQRRVTIRARAFELRAGELEVGSGSLRNHDLETQERVFNLFGYDRETVVERFGPLLEAFTYGVPPHGGLALGLDRLLALAVGEEGLAEVIPFPADAEGRYPHQDAPGPIEAAFLAALLGQ